MGELQQTLIRNDAYLPWVRQELSRLTREATLAASGGNPEPVRDGINRPVGDDAHGWTGRPGDWIGYRFGKMTDVRQASVILDSGLDRNVALSYHQKDDQLTSLPDVMPEAFRIEGLAGDAWQPLIRVGRNRRRLCRFAVDRSLAGVRLVLEATWGAPASRVYAFYLD
jgi:hypothetical protein